MRGSNGRQTIVAVLVLAVYVYPKTVEAATPIHAHAEVTREAGYVVPAVKQLGGAITERFCTAGTPT